MHLLRQESTQSKLKDTTVLMRLKSKSSLTPSQLCVHGEVPSLLWVLVSSSTKLGIILHIFQNYNKNGRLQMS